MSFPERYLNDIKIRLWIKSKQKMLHYDSIADVPDYFQAKGNFKRDDIVMMLGTETKAIDGRFIYEGDIVKYHPYNFSGKQEEPVTDNEERWWNKLFVIEWKSAYNRFGAESAEYGYQGKDMGLGGSYCGGEEAPFEVALDYYEIVGNVFENPNLIQRIKE